MDIRIGFVDDIRKSNTRQIKRRLPLVGLNGESCVGPREPLVCEPVLFGRKDQPVPGL